MTMDENSTEASTATAGDAPLTAHDRCDSCGAQAYVRAVMANGELLFCAHHAAEYEGKLKPVALSWHDETSRLLESEPA